MKILFLTILFFCLLNCDAQKKWYGMDSNDWISEGAQFGAGYFDALNQDIQFYRIGKGSHFWDYSTSWKNKYKGFDKGDFRPAFFGSKTVFVGVTDGYHLTRTLETTCILISFGLSTEDLSPYRKQDRWKVILKKVIVATIANRLAFNIFYK